jgi:hypothetical protein
MSRYVIVDVDEGTPSAVRATFTFRDVDPPFLPPRLESATGIRTGLLRDAVTGQWKVRIDGLSRGSHAVRVAEGLPGRLTSLGPSVPWRVGEGVTDFTAALPPSAARGRLAIDVRFGGAEYLPGRMTPMRFRVLGDGATLGEVALEGEPLEVEVPAGLALRVEAVRWPGWRAFPAPAPVEVSTRPGGTARATIDLGPALLARFRFREQFLDFGTSIWRVDEQGRTFPCSDLLRVVNGATTVAALPSATYFARVRMYGTPRTYSARFTVDSTTAQAIDLLAEPEEGEPFVLTVEDGSGEVVKGEVRFWGLATRMEDDPSFDCDLTAGSTPPIRLSDGDYLLSIGGRGVRRFSVRGGRPTESTAIRVPLLRPRWSDEVDPSVAAPGTLVVSVELPPSVEPYDVGVVAEPTGPGWGAWGRREPNGTTRIGPLAPGAYRVWVVPHQWTPDLSPGPHAAVTIPKEHGVEVSLRPGWAPYRPSSGERVEKR